MGALCASGSLGDVAKETVGDKVNDKKNKSPNSNSQSQVPNDIHLQGSEAT